MSSRLLRHPSGRAYAVEVTVPSAGLEHGHRFGVLGDELLRPHGFGWTGQTDARPPTPDESQDALRRVGVMRGEANNWTDEHRAEARRLWAEERLSWTQIAERVCGDKRYKSTVQGWL